MTHSRAPPCSNWLKVANVVRPFQCKSYTYRKRVCKPLYIKCTCALIQADFSVRQTDFVADFLSETFPDVRWRTWNCCGVYKRRIKNNTWLVWFRMRTRAEFPSTFWSTFHRQPVRREQQSIQIGCVQSALLSLKTELMCTLEFSCQRYQWPLHMHRLSWQAEYLAFQHAVGIWMKILVDTQNSDFRIKSQNLQLMEPQVTRNCAQ